MRRAVFLMLLVALGGCSSGKAQDVATCRAEADRFYQAYRDDDVANPSVGEEFEDLGLDRVAGQRGERQRTHESGRGRGCWVTPWPPTSR